MALAFSGAPAWAAFSADGPARVRAGAVQGNFLDLALAGTRLVAVGERGHVLLSDDAGKAWRQAKAVPTRTTLTCLHATDARTLWAAGHGGVILKSTDAGETWALLAGQADGADVLLSIRVDADGRGLAVGGFGFARATADGGASWKTLTLLEGEAGEKHFNRIFVSGAGTWLVAAEGGQVLRSADRGAVADMKWAAVATPYKGSLWCGLALPGGLLLAGGMRGNVVRSTDDGLTWTHQAVAGAGSFTGASLLADGRVALVGVDGTLVLGDARGENFRLRRLDDRATLTAVQPQAGGALVLATQAGLRSVPAPAN
ncbi:putative photosystem II stability/assembly factor-like protein [Burkholderiales bacterium JOSHI_001]|nr:putative photosystem II stability/assembly factor-like protein [Burkholderiales bacterium JOSHI_001]